MLLNKRRNISALYKIKYLNIVLTVWNGYSNAADRRVEETVILLRLWPLRWEKNRSKRGAFPFSEQTTWNSTVYTADTRWIRNHDREIVDNKLSAVRWLFVLDIIKVGEWTALLYIAHTNKKYFVF